MIPRPALFSFDSLRNALSVFLFLGLLAYGQTAFYPFVHDDVVLIQNNPNISNLSNVLSVFSQNTSPDPSQSLSNPYYRPLLEIYYRVVFMVGGGKPWFFHFLNIIWHVGNAFLLFVLMRKLAVPLGVSWVVGVLFLIHPVQTESVACIAGVSNLLCFLWILASFVMYLQARVNGAPRYWLATAAFFVLGLLTKEQAVVLPFLILAYEIIIAPRSGRTEVRRFIGVFTFFLVLAIYALWRKQVLGVWPVSADAASGEFMLRVKSIPQLLFTYVSVITWPVGLHYYRSVDMLAASGKDVLVGAFGLLGAGVLCVLSHVRYSALMVFALAWFLITLLPVLNIAPLVIEYSHIMAAEHFVYMALFGFLLFIVTFFYQLWTGVGASKERRLVVGALFCLALGSLLLTIRQNMFWRHESALFERMVKFEPQLGRCHLLLAKQYYAQQKVREALQEYNAALDIMRGYLSKVSNDDVRRFYAGFIKEIYFDVAHCYEALRQYPLAISYYKSALMFAPEDSVLYNNLGMDYLRINRLDEAIANFQKAVTFEPNNVMALNNLALCYVHLRRPAEARELFERILQINPNFQPARKNLEVLSQGI